MRNPRFKSQLLRREKIDEITNCLAVADKDTVVCMGDYGNDNRDGRLKVGSPSGPIKVITRCFGHKCTVMVTDEFRTSMLCHQCHHLLEQQEDDLYDLEGSALARHPTATRSTASSALAKGTVPPPMAVTSMPATTSGNGAWNAKLDPRRFPFKASAVGASSLNMGRLVALAALFMLGVSIAPALCYSLRGVAPEVLVRYETAGETFTCFDGQKSVSIAKVNDDYCDCADGSDEPSTSACSRGHFHCENRGFQPKTLASCFVDDGACDCCDGSDEPSGRCANTCSVLGEEALGSLLTQIKDMKAGLAVRVEYEQRAARLLASWREEIAELERKIPREKSKKNSLESALMDGRIMLTRAGDVLSRHRSLRQSAPHRLSSAEARSEVEQGVKARRKAEEEQRAAQARQEEEKGAAEVTTTDGSSPVEATLEPEKSLAGEAESEEELARRVTAQWIPGQDRESSSEQDPHEEVSEQGLDAAAGEASEEPLMSADELLEASRLHESDASFSEEHEDEEEEQGASDWGVSEYLFHDLTEDCWSLCRATHAWQRLLLRAARLCGALTRRAWRRALAALHLPKHKIGRGSKRNTGFVSLAEAEEELRAARERASASSSRLREMEAELKALKAKAEADYGGEPAWAALAGRCFSATVDKYTYEVCPFDRATQKEGTGSHVSLGRHASLDLSIDPGALVFHKGQHCWSGPDRSMRVRLVCGPAEKLRDVQEPSRCEYASALETPLACTDAALQRLEAELRLQRGRMGLGSGDARDEL
ncbi:subunit beta of glucosidase II-like protein [Helicosporidium sp. ATCC 50920]|nr:subunit beta of glucosidase II-like protein [Helicosporidium sp. ATCC 50920]|eukprot:KDD75177.1 subunit beta of glucosidase II-like protein [Helicosporidium sp. ATCC 50920]